MPKRAYPLPVARPGDFSSSAWDASSGARPHARDAGAWGPRAAGDDPHELRPVAIAGAFGEQTLSRVTVFDFWPDRRALAP